MEEEECYPKLEEEQQQKSLKKIKPVKNLKSKTKSKLTTSPKPKSELKIDHEK